MSFRRSALRLCQTGHSCPDTLYNWGTVEWHAEDNYLGFLRSPIGQSLSSGGQAECCILAPELPNWSPWGQECKDVSLRTEALLWFQGEDMAGTLCRAELRFHASEVRARFICWLRLEFLSMMAPS